MSQRLKSELNRIIDELRIKYNPEKIVLYGSVARGRERVQSDLDIVIIKNTNVRFYDRIGEVMRLVKPREAVDLLVYTPDEYERLKQDSWFIGEEVHKKGTVVYGV